MVKKNLLIMHASLDPDLSVFLSLTICIVAKSAVCVAPEPKHLMFCQWDHRHVIHPPNVPNYIREMPFRYCTDIFIGFYDLDIRKGPAWQFTFENIERDLVQIMNIMRLRFRDKRVHLSVGIPERPTDKDTTPNETSKRSAPLKSDLEYYAEQTFPSITIPNETFLRLKPFQSDLEYFAEQTLSYMKAYDHAGLNIYWTSSYSYTETRKLVELMATLRRRVDRMWEEPKLKLSVTFNAFPLKGLIPSNLYKIHRYIDFFIVKAFDKSVDSTPIKSHTHPWFQSPQQEQDPVLRYLSQAKSVKWYVEHGIPAEKIIIAFPTYVRALIYAPPEFGARYPNTSYYFTIIQPRSAMCQHYQLGYWTNKWNENKTAYYSTRRIGFEWPMEYMFFHGRESISSMCKFVRDEAGYRGLMAWTMFMDGHLEHLCARETFETIKSGFYNCVTGWDFRLLAHGG